MATYKQIQEYVQKNNGYVPKTCWIAHVKELSGLNPKVSGNRRDAKERICPCPPSKKEDIRKAFEHFKMI